jgi:hypothetical protein
MRLSPPLRKILDPPLSTCRGFGLLFILPFFPAVSLFTSQCVRKGTPCCHGSNRVVYHSHAFRPHKQYYPSTCKNRWGGKAICYLYLEVIVTYDSFSGHGEINEKCARQSESIDNTGLWCSEGTAGINPGGKHRGSSPLPHHIIPRSLPLLCSIPMHFPSLQRSYAQYYSYSRPAMPYLASPLWSASDGIWRKRR